MKNKGGRPKKAPKDSRSEIVLVRMTPAERAACEKAAETAGIRLSEWIRERVAKAVKRQS
jgi:predicted HicB family RNase H-like nuclease